MAFTEQNGSQQKSATASDQTSDNLWLGTKPMNIITPALLFMLWSPGYLITINPTGFQKLEFPRFDTSKIPMLLAHMAAFAGTYWFLRAFMPEVY